MNGTMRVAAMACCLLALLQGAHALPSPSGGSNDDRRRPPPPPPGPRGPPPPPPGPSPPGTALPFPRRDIEDLRNFRSMDGTGNNRDNTAYGAAPHVLLRKEDASYADGLSEPITDRANARAISNAIMSQSEAMLSTVATDMVWQWGQFLDHDIDLSPHADPAEHFNIAVPAGDPHFDPQNTGQVEIGLERAAYQVDSEGVRQQTNVLTAFVDASNVYGSDDVRAAALRAEGGRLKTTPSDAGDMLPYNSDGLANAGTGAHFFLAGDIRANEQAGLTCLHTLFVREHNRIVDDMLVGYDLSAEQRYQVARTIVAAEMQAITYNEFHPALIGQRALRRYENYRRNVNPDIMNEFSTAAYRFGHSMVSGDFTTVDAAGNVNVVPLREAFFNPSYVETKGVDDLLRGLTVSPAQVLDHRVTDNLRNFLFGAPGAGGFDLVSLNIQRGRDHGLPSYNDARVQWGLDPITAWSDITPDAQLQQALASVYPDVNNADLWVAGLCEAPERGSLLGPTFTRIIADQFERLRDGDRYWYERLPRSLVDYVRNRSLKDIIVDNTGVARDEIPDNVFRL